MLEPEGLICDEPVSMLDASVRTQILAVLLELKRRRGLGLLFITHDLSLAWALCDRIAVMYLGRIVEQGLATDVIERPRHPYTEALVTAVPVPAAGGGGTRELLTGELPDATDIPQGCRFHPRCPRRFEPCDGVDPALIPTGGNGQVAACLLHDQSLAKQARGRWLSRGGARSGARSAGFRRGPATRSRTSRASWSATRRPRAASAPG